MSLRYLSICSGIEAASVAWHSLGWSPIGFSEIEPFPSAVLAHHYGSNLPGKPLASNGVPNYGDFTTLIDTPPDCDLLVGGTPCQAFSIAGSRRSLDDARGNLSLQFVRLAHAIADRRPDRPFRVVWENVPGVLSLKDNAFGCFLGGLVGADDPLVSPLERGRWPDAGMASGPRARLAWRILDAQYFGLAQRRRRVFVVGNFGDGGDPAAVLFEPRGVHGNFAEGREAGEAVAGTLGAHPSGSGGLGTDFDLDGGLIAHAPELAMCLNAGAMGRRDAESETLIVANGGGFDDGPPHTLRAEGFDASEDGTGRGTPLVPVDAIQERAVSENPAAGPDGAGFREGVAYTLEARQQVQAIAFDTTQITSSGNYSSPKDGAPCHPLAAAAHPPALAFALRGRDGGAQVEIQGEQTGALRAANGGSSRDYIAFSSKDHGGDAGALSPTLRAGNHTSSHANAGAPPAVAGAGAVRRLTPRECERLQGFPDDYTAITWRGKTPQNCPDGPRYKALGNSMAVPVMRWIGERIQQQIEHGHTVPKGGAE